MKVALTTNCSALIESKYWEYVEPSMAIPIEHTGQSMYGVSICGFCTGMKIVSPEEVAANKNDTGENSEKCSREC